MSTHEHESQETAEEESAYSETVLATRDEQDIMACSLVLSSVGISHRVGSSSNTIFLQVSRPDLHAAHFQIQSYRVENRNWPPKVDTSVKNFEPLLQPPTLLLVGALALFYSVTGPWSAHSNWFIQGAGDAAKILQQQEYYRLVTALTLHADTVHLLGNCLFGGFLFHFFCRLTGNGLGLFSMLLTASLGNYSNVYLHGEDHLFIGFSTAVFAIIGMLAMLGRHDRVSKRYIRVIPFMAGAALLAMIGSSGERTDLGAHFFGLCCGFVMGWILGRPLFLRLRKSIWLQTSLFLISCAIIIRCWHAALT